MEREKLLDLYPLPVPGSATRAVTRSKSSSKKDGMILGFIKDGHIIPGRDDHVLRAFIAEKATVCLDGCLQYMEFLPEWFLVDSFAFVSRTLLFNRSFDHGKLVTELRRLPFETILSIAKAVLEELDSSSNSYSLEILAWASALVESHFTEWTLTDDSHATLFRLNELFTDQIDSMFLWQDVQGRLKGLIDASRTAAAAVKEDVKYWHSLIEF